jgi:hypothetical protein
MKELILKREIISNKAILGTLLSDSEELCKTLENPWKNNAPNISCIPEGIFRCKKDDTGKFQFYKILDVGGRSGVEIHNGNKEQHTKGCILVGEDWIFMDKELAISNSKKTIKKLKGILPDEFNLTIMS